MNAIDILMNEYKENEADVFLCVCVCVILDSRLNQLNICQHPALIFFFVSFIFLIIYRILAIKSSPLSTIDYYSTDKSLSRTNIFGFIHFKIIQQSEIDTDYCSLLAIGCWLLIVTEHTIRNS